MAAASDRPSLAIRRFGTEEAPAPSRLLRAGALTASFEAGNLRHIRYGGVEAMRAVAFVVRDANWGTYDPVLADLVVTEEPDVFVVTYTATVDDGTQRLRYAARISGHADGRLDFTAKATAETDFRTNRTGFVVLHPIAGVAGAPVTVEDVDGGITQGRFPELIDPVQPLMRLRALTHEAEPGLRVSCRMVGDTFETEDQRNWTDASFKTYVRPLALPWPYVLPGGEAIEQGVHLAVTGTAASAATADASVTLALGDAIGRFPAVGAGYDPDADRDARSHASLLRRLGAAHLVCHYDPRRGHGRDTLAEAAALAGLIGAVPWLEAVVTGVEEAEAEVAALGEAVRALGSPFAVVLLSPAADLKGTLPGSPWPPAPAAEHLCRVARAAFPEARIGGGMFSFFTELNRKRPPAHLLDLVAFTTTALVHAKDDLSVMESLEALPAIVRSARAIAGDTPLAVGPSAIGMRLNPYGDTPLPNPHGTRRAMNLNDPRQRGLLGAAWAVGYVAEMARAGVAAVTLGGLTGPFGLVHAPQSWPQPWFDRHGGLFPTFHAVRGLAALAGLPMRVLSCSAPSAVAAVAVETPEGLTIWAANLTETARTLVLPSPVRDLCLIDDESFEAAARDGDALTTLTRPHEGLSILLTPYAVARLRLA